MRFDLTTVTADVTPLVREIPADVVAAPPEDFAVDGALTLDVVLVRRRQGEYQVRGGLTGSLLVQCSRCLEPFVLPLDATFDLQYLPTSSMIDADEREIREGDLAAEFYEDEAIDLGLLAREQCYLTLPMKPLCTPDCRGLCPQCGVNLNNRTCDCNPQWVDPRLAGLKALLPDDRES